MRILLLNPPGNRPFLRDYYCSTVSKAGYLWHPIDLLIQSGHLGQLGRLSLLDAIAERLTPNRALDKIAQLRPDLVYSLVGAQSTRSDLAFLAEVSRRCSTPIAVSGEPLLGDIKRLVGQAPWVAAWVRNFTTGALADWIRAGTLSQEPVVLDSRWPRHNIYPAGERMTYPMPVHAPFLSRRYQIPFDGGRVHASVLTAFGCPFRCTYCNSGIDSLGYRERELDDVFEELEQLRMIPAVGHVSFRDMNFTTPRQRTLSICEWLSRHNTRLPFNCYSRPDSLDEQMCASLARAGCRLVQMGVESIDPKTLSAHKRPMSTHSIRKAFRLVRRFGMRSGAHFVFGLEGEGEEAVKASVDEAIRLNPDYVSFNLVQRRFGSNLTACKSSLPDREGLVRLRRRAYLRYYLRPGYLWKMAEWVRSSPEDLAGLFRSAFYLARSSLQGEQPHGEPRN
jgi:anaerobic magnesium-protoporphyrin IX monomethyl ester cyclase